MGDYNEKIAVVFDLLKKGVTEISLIGDDIFVKKDITPSADISQSSIAVTVDNSPDFLKDVFIRSSIETIKKENLEINPDSTGKVSGKLDELEKELCKSEPDKSTLKRILKWSLDRDGDLSLQISMLVSKVFPTRI